MFYIIERQDQLDKLGPFNDCFVRFIPQNDNFHPSLSPLSLIYIRSLSDHKGYILCLSHTESFSLDMSVTLNWLNNNTGKLWVMDKKQAMYWFPYPDKLYDVNFITIPNLTGSTYWQISLQAGAASTQSFYNTTFRILGRN